MMMSAVPCVLQLVVQKSYTWVVAFFNMYCEINFGTAAYCIFSTSSFCKDLEIKRKELIFLVGFALNEYMYYNYYY